MTSFDAMLDRQASRQCDGYAFLEAMDRVEDSAIVESLTDKVRESPDYIAELIDTLAKASGALDRLAKGGVIDLPALHDPNWPDDVQDFRALIRAADDAYRMRLEVCENLASESMR